MVGHGVGPGVARTKQRRAASRRWHRRSRTSGGNRTRPCRSGRRSPCARCGSRPRRRRCRGSPGRSPWSLPIGDQTSARISAMAPAMPALVCGVISWKVRNTVESEGTEPNRSVLQAQVLDVRTALATTGQHQRDLDEDLPPVVQRERVHRSVGCGRTVNHPVPNGRQNTQERAVRRGPPPLRHRVPQRRDACWYRSLWKCPPGRDSCCVEHQQFPLLGGLFRGRGSSSSSGFVNSPG